MTARNSTQLSNGEHVTGHFNVLDPSSKAQYRKSFKDFVIITLRFANAIHLNQVPNQDKIVPFCLDDNLAILVANLAQGGVTLKSVQEWCLSLFKTRYNSRRLWTCPIQWYLLSQSLTINKEQTGDGGEIQTAQSVTTDHCSGPFAHVQYSARLLFWGEAHKYISEEREGEILALHNYVEEGAEQGMYPMTRLRKALTAARHFSPPSTPVLDIQQRGPNGHYAVGANGIFADKSSMGYAVDAITRQLDVCLEEDLLFGRGDNWPAITHPIHDDMTEASAGHSFLGNPKNVHLQQTGSSLAEMVARTPGLRSRFLQDGALDSKELKKYFEIQKKFLGLLFTAIHLTAGIPARASESSCLLIVNTGDKIRNIMFQNNKLFIAYRWKKQTNLTGLQRPIPRFPSSRVANILVRYLTLVHPFLVSLAAQMPRQEEEGCPPEQTISMYLFGSLNGVMRGDELRNAFKSNMAKLGKLPFGIQPYRHVVIALFRKFVAEDVKDDLVDDWIEEFAGHSTFTGRERYGNSKQMLHNGFEFDLAKNNWLCRTWQKWLGEQVSMPL